MAAEASNVSSMLPDDRNRATVSPAKQEAHKPHSIRAALEDYLAGLRGIDSNLSLGAAEDLGEKALADLDGLLEQLEALRQRLVKTRAEAEEYRELWQEAEGRS